jgi:NhaA family Na+:H+ antiporter
VLFGLLMWAAVLKSGVHATLAGVLTALFIPLKRFDDPEVSPLKAAEHGLKPWVYFLIMPAFAFANAGVPLAGVSLADLFAPLPLGIALGLFLGKQAGVFGFAWLAVKAGVASLPDGLAWRQVYGAALLAGIGFTMSLFIGSLAFPEPETLNAVRIGVLAGSLAAGLAGYAILRFTPAPRPKPAAAAAA